MQKICVFPTKKTSLKDKNIGLLKTCKYATVLLRKTGNTFDSKISHRKKGYHKARCLILIY